jgi:hypothetical protein
MTTSGAANDNDGPATDNSGDGVHLVEVSSEGNVTEAILEDGVVSVEPIAGEDHTPPDPADNDNSSGGNSAA